LSDHHGRPKNSKCLSNLHAQMPLKPGPNLARTPPEQGGENMSVSQNEEKGIAEKETRFYCLTKEAAKSNRECDTYG